ncbi:hypothetical protein B7L70_08640 [Vulcanisaeta sp. EB80]|nr:hypothetical protein B7L70_08640 [Vulcanisaeta sp. EB80]
MQRNQTPSRRHQPRHQPTSKAGFYKPDTEPHVAGQPRHEWRDLSFITSKVKHEVRPIDGFPDLIRALGDPHVRKGLGLIIEILRSLGRCLEAAEMAEKVKAGSGPVCSLELPCYLIAYGVGSDNNA